jgi:hypothetical protein
VQVWKDSDKAKLAVATEASALRAVVLFAETLPDEQRMHFRALVNRHVEEVVNREWPAMAHQRLTLTTLSTLVEAQQLAVSLQPQDESQRPSGRSWLRCTELWMRGVSASCHVIGAARWI